jgi:type I site-specific restriction endonuclease
MCPVTNTGRTGRAVPPRRPHGILLTHATGTGKTMVALQLVTKLRKSDWTAGPMPRVLYLANRNILIDQPKDGYVPSETALGRDGPWRGSVGCR